MFDKDCSLPFFWYSVGHLVDLSGYVLAYSTWRGTLSQVNLQGVI